MRCRGFGWALGFDTAIDAGCDRHFADPYDVEGRPVTGWSPAGNQASPGIICGPSFRIQGSLKAPKCADPIRWGPKIEMKELAPTR
jgi:hypothetical protein